MKIFCGLHTPAVFIQNIIPDLFLGLNLKPVLRMFHGHVRKACGAEPGYTSP